MQYTETQKDFREKNLTIWKDILNKIFKGPIPEHYEWNSVQEINDIIRQISIISLNHMIFPYPEGGGLDIIGCTISENNKDEIEISTGIPLICKPRVLVFDSIDSEPEWSYFRLELQEMKPSGVYQNTEKMHEELYENAPGEFEMYSDYKPNEYCRHIVRLLKGGLLIVPKTSYYNNIPSTYDGRHSKYSNETFKEYMRTLKNSGNYVRFLIDYTK